MKKLSLLELGKNHLKEIIIQVLLVTLLIKEI